MVSQDEANFPDSDPVDGSGIEPSPPDGGVEGAAGSAPAADTEAREPRLLPLAGSWFVRVSFRGDSPLVPTSAQVGATIEQDLQRRYPLFFVHASAERTDR